MVKAAAAPPSTAAKNRKASRPLPSPDTGNSNAKKRTLQSALRNPKTPNSLFPDSGVRRSTRPKPILVGLWSALEYNDDDEDDDDDDEDERELKKQKLVQRLKSEPVARSYTALPRSNGVKIEAIMERTAEGCGSEAKHRSGNVSSARDREDRVVEDGSGPTTPMPAKKTILFILDRLQKKDTHGVFSEPVDPEELPDYHEIIENPMDFSTVRRKLDNGLYETLEQFEEDVFLLCSNAMQYNSPSTVYFRKARTIQELAKRDFENLRQKGENGEPQPRVIRRGRPPKTIEKFPAQDSIQVINTESPSVAALGPVTENSKNYNIRKGLSPIKFVTDETLVMGTGDPSCNGTNNGLQEWNSEFPASILRAPYGKKPVVVDETRRDTYRQPVTSADPAINMLMTEPKTLLPVGAGMTEQHVYPSSIARFAAGLGPEAWEICLKKIKQSLAPNVEFDPLQFAYESPKFAIDEVDDYLRPVIPTTGDNAPLKTSSFTNVIEAKVEIADKARSQNNLNHANVKTSSVSLPVSPTDPREADFNNRAV